MSPSDRGFRALLTPALFTLVGVIVLAALGTWQLERKAWKEKLLATLAARLQQAPSALPAKSEWPGLTANSEFQRVRFPAAFVSGQEAFVYALGPAGPGGSAGPGYLVFSQARLANGDFIVVNRGFVPEGGQPKAADSGGNGQVDVTGILRWPEPVGLFTPADNPVRNVWFRRDHLAIAAAKGWGQTAPFYVDLESPAPPGGLPRPTLPSLNIPNNHLQYALTWFALAGALAGVFGVFAWGRMRAADGPNMLA